MISPSSSNLPVNPLLEAVLPEAPLLPTGRTVQSLTGRVPVVCDGAGTRFYCKQDLEQYVQLTVLAQLGIPVVAPVLAAEGGTFLSREQGRSLSAALGESGTALRDCRGFASLGQTLSTIHASLAGARIESRIEGWISDDAGRTGNICANFRHRFVARASAAANAFLGSAKLFADGPLREVSRQLRALIERGMSLLAAIERRSEPAQLIYGDFKPENILFRRCVRSGFADFVLIDPQICRGAPAMDLAKFMSRTLMAADAPRACDLLAAFLEGYGAARAGSGPSVPLLAALDAANIMSAYLGRLAKGESGFEQARLFRCPQSLQRLSLLLEAFKRLPPDESPAAFLSELGHGC